MKAVFHGHSFVEVLFDDKRILIDPFVVGNKSCDLTVEQVLSAPIDAVIVTHGHDDHIGCTKDISEKYNCPLITSFELGTYFEKVLELKNVSTQGIGGGVQYDGFHVKLFQAQHGGGITSMDHGYSTVATGVVLDTGSRKVYHAGDTGLFGDMSLLESLKIDVAFLPIGDRYTMGIEDATIAAGLIKAKYTVPIHYNTRENIKADDIAFARQVLLASQSIPKVLRPGQAVVFE